MGKNGLMPTPMTFRRGLGLVAVAALLATGCGAKGASEGSSVTTAPSGEPAATTVVAGETTVPDSTTTEPDDGMVTSDDLEAILPSASDIGPGYSEVRNDRSDANEPDPIGDALTAQCPEVEELNGDDEDDDDEVSAKFEDDEGRSIEVKLSPTAKERSPDELATFIEAVNGCDDITASDAKFDYSITLAAGEEPSLGDQAIRLALSITISGGDLPGPLALNTYGYIFRIGTVGGQITGSDGTDGTTRIKFDSDDLDPLVLDMEARVDDLLGN